MYPVAKTHEITYIYNGPYTVVSTAQKGFSRTVRGIVDNQVVRNDGQVSEKQDKK